MKELIDKYLGSGLAEFEGLEITGSIPIKQEIINDAIASFLQSATEEKSAPPETPVAAAVDVMPGAEGGGSSKPRSGGIPLKTLLGMVKRAEVQAVEGKLIVHFTVKR